MTSKYPANPSGVIQALADKFTLAMSKYTPNWQGMVQAIEDIVVSGGGGGGSGTVTSVALSMPAGVFGVTGSPVTTSGTFTVTLSSQGANLVLASPNGSSGAPSFRALTTTDISGLGTAATQDVVTATFNANKLQGLDISTSSPVNGQALVWNSTSSKWEPGIVGAGSGTVTSVGATSSTTQLTITGSPVTTSGTLNFTLDTTANVYNANKLQSRDVGTTSPSNNQVLAWDGGTLKWEPKTLSTLGAGTVTSVGVNSSTTELSVSGSPVTTSGTINLALDTTANVYNANKLQGRDVATTAPSASQVLAWNAGTLKWEPTNAGSGSGTVTSVGVSSTIPQLVVTNSPVTTSGTIQLDLDTTAGIYNANRLQGRLLVNTAPTNGQVIAWNNGSGQWEPATPNTGTVTSVALSLPSFITVTGSPITTSGTLTGTLASQSANTFLAAPNGSSGAPTFRTLLYGDVSAIVGTTSSTIAAGNDTRFHTQNTDTGTTQTSFQLASGSSGVRIKNSSGSLLARDSADSVDADIQGSILKATSTRIEVNSVRVTFSNSAPSSPSGGDLWYEWASSIDRINKWAWPWEWNGTYWLSPIFDGTSCVLRASTALLTAQSVVVPSGLNIYVVDAAITGNYVGTVNGSNYYRYRLVRSKQLATSINVIWSVNVTATPFTHTSTINTHYDLSSLTMDSVRAELQLGAGSPGTIYVQENMRYRYARP